MSVSNSALWFNFPFRPPLVKIKLDPAFCQVKVIVQVCYHRKTLSFMIIMIHFIWFSFFFGKYKSFNFFFFFDDERMPVAFYSTGLIPWDIHARHLLKLILFQTALNLSYGQCCQYHFVSAEMAENFCFCPLSETKWPLETFRSKFWTI